MSDTPMPQRSFVSKDIDVSDFSQIEPFLRSLVDREINSVVELEQWLLDFSELTAVVSEYGNRCHIDQSCHTDDSEIEAKYMHFVENIDPKVKPWVFRLKQKYLACGFLDALEDPKYSILTREWESDVEVFRDENIPLQTECTVLGKEHGRLFGAMLIDFQGEELTMQQMARYLEDPDRAVRKEAFELMMSRRLQDRDALDDTFDGLLEARHKIAQNAGFPDYSAYHWKTAYRFDYTPDDCHRFADAIEETCMPLIRKINADRAEVLGLERLRPWDMGVDPKNRDPLRPFDPDRVSDLVDGCREIFSRLSPDLAEEFARLEFGRNLDLDSRKGKRPGGYQASLLESKQPFIFMNAAGLHCDVETLLHEGGHAFHALWSFHEPLVFLQHAPIEFAEVASMGMELLADQHMSVFYNEEDAVRAVRVHLEGIIQLLPWVATIDQFQHWLYTHPGHARDERTEAWLAISDRFRDPLIDMTGYEDVRDAEWQKQLHLFLYPFYYVEYGIAELGALQLWAQAQKSLPDALQNYRTALSLGGTRSLPDLFATAGLTFDFSAKTVRPLMDLVSKKLDELPV